MIKEIIKDQFILGQKCEDATHDDLEIVQDLLDTIQAHQDHCVGIAANMIGIRKNIIVVQDEEPYLIMFNPRIIKTMGRCYEADEGCLSHEGTKKAKRFDKIKVEYRDEKFKMKIKTFSGFTAQIIQHEIDHCYGILI